MFHILLIDGAADTATLMTAVNQGSYRPCRLHHVTDGPSAMHFLNRTDHHEQAPRPDLVILNLEWPRQSGLEVLSAIKGSPQWCALPVIVMSPADPDAITRAYALHANCCVVRPDDTRSLVQVMHSIEHFWTTVAKLPTHH
ncbi:MAG: hypothetical protein RLY71_314 [Pseudomonadota bacterium]|jgi:CheY-like chemotaxis protein